MRTRTGLDLTYVCGKSMHSLNPRMAERQKLDQAGVDAIKALHVRMHEAKDRARKSRKRDRRDVAAEIESIEFEMQVRWGFPRDATMHTHWLLTPGCTCPRPPNAVLRGYPARVVAEDCPLHDATPRNDGIAVVRDRTRDRQDVDAVAEAVAVLGIAHGNA